MNSPSPLQKFHVALYSEKSRGSIALIAPHSLFLKNLLKIILPHRLHSHSHPTIQSIIKSDSKTFFNISVIFIKWMIFISYGPICLFLHRLSVGSSYIFFFSHVLLYPPLCQMRVPSCQILSIRSPLQINRFPKIFPPEFFKSHLREAKTVHPE